MILSLARKGLRRGKARFICAAAGVAAAAGAVVFTFSLAATNTAQAPALARRAAAPSCQGADVVTSTSCTGAPSRASRTQPPTIHAS